MVPSREIKTDELERIARQFNVKVEAVRGTTTFGNIWSRGLRMLGYRRVDIFVSGERAGDVKGCVCEIFKFYGKPDEVPRALFGSKKAGKKIIDDALRNFDQTVTR